MHGAEGTSNFIENHIPRTTDNTPTNIAINDMLNGDLAHCLAAAAGIIINDIKSKIPIT